MYRFLHPARRYYASALQTAFQDLDATWQKNPRENDATTQRDIGGLCSSMVIFCDFPWVCSKRPETRPQQLEACYSLVSPNTASWEIFEPNGGFKGTNCMGNFPLPCLMSLFNMFIHKQICSWFTL